MAARLGSVVLATAAGIGVCGAATLALPWWTAAAPVLLVPSAPAQVADAWRGWEVVGAPGTGLVIVLALGAVIAVVVSRFARPLVAAAGAAEVAAAVCVLVGWGATTAPGAWLAGAAGLAALAGAAGRPVLVVLGAAAVAATAVVALPGPGPVAERAGAWIRLAPFAAGTLRAGTATLPDGPSRLVTVDGSTAVATADAIVGLDARGRSRVLARTDVPGEILGVAGDRVARRIAADRLRVTSLRADDPVDLEIYAVATVGPVGPDGALWLRADGDPPGAVRVLPLDLYQGPQRLAATFLPVLSIGFPAGSTPVDPEDVVPVRDGGLRLVDRGGGSRLERITVTSAAATVDVVAGGADPACGLTRSARDAHLAGTTAGPARAPDGGIWLAVGTRLLHVDAVGTLRAVPDPLPGPVTSLLVTDQGTDVDAAVSGPAEVAGVWRLPSAAAATVELPPTPACVSGPQRAGPPVAFLPVGTTGPERDGIPLSVTGRWASQIRGRVAAVTGTMRVPLGDRGDRGRGPVVPDGSGGVWWVEQGGEPTRRTIVHGRPGENPERSPEVVASPDAVLVPDLGGRPPLLGTADGLVGVPGATVPQLPGPVTGGAVRADGRGWFLVDGRLVAAIMSPAGATVLGPVIDGRADPAPAAVQLARGIAPAALGLTGARVVLDGAGRPVVVCADGVVLRVDPGSGAVAVIAQDPLLVAPVTVEGGIVQNTDGTLQRVDLPG